MKYKIQPITILMAEVAAPQALYLAKQQGCSQVVRLHAGQVMGDH